MSWLSFTARKWFSAALTIARRCDGARLERKTYKIPEPDTGFPANEEPATFFYVQKEIDRLLGAKRAEEGDEGAERSRRAGV